MHTWYLCISKTTLPPMGTQPFPKRQAACPLRSACGNCEPVGYYDPISLEHGPVFFLPQEDRKVSLQCCKVGSCLFTFVLSHKGEGSSGAT